MPKLDTSRDPYFLADRIHARASFTAEMLKFYPNAMTEVDATAVWTILEDIAADAKKLMEVVAETEAPTAGSQKAAPCGEVAHA
jgi:hypothetical protein